MFVYGIDWLDRVDTEWGSREFQDLYQISVWEYIVRYELFNINHISSNKYRHIVFLEGADSSINCLLSLTNEDKREHLVIYNNVGEEHIFNTDGMAIIRLIRDSKDVAMFVVDNSPYDIKNNDEDNEFLESEYETTRQKVIDKINKILENNKECFPEKSQEPYKATIENTLIVGQL